MPGRGVMDRSLRLVAICLVASALGCSYNPGYFPYYLPPGWIKATHAKPRGPGYFRNFDPKACRLEVVPQQTTSPPGSAVVLVASVYDKDGQPRRGRRVEWLLEGPGHILEVDESGLYAGRGYKVDNQYAVSYTNYTSRTITRGNADERDDVAIAPGQTFCVISSAVPGETSVTAIAPGVFNWDSGRVVVKIFWADGTFAFPPPVVTRFGGEAVLTTKIRGTETDAESLGYRVRYRVVDGAPAVLITRSGQGTGSSASGTSAKETETFADARGEASVRLAQPTPQPGRTVVAVEIVKPSENGVGPGTVVSRRETVVDWAAPEMELNLETPRSIGVNAITPVTVSLTNLGQVAGSGGVLRVSLPPEVQVVRTDPPAGSSQGVLTWSFGEISPGSRQEFTLQLRTTQLGAFPLSATVQTSDGMRAEKRATIGVERAGLRGVLEVPAHALANDQCVVKLAVTNPGLAPAQHVTAWVRLDERLQHTSGQNPVEVEVGEVAPGQTRTIELPLRTGPSGPARLRASLTADGGVTANIEPATVNIVRAELAVSVQGPVRAYIGQDLTWAIAVRNPGEVPLTNTRVRASLPESVKGHTASDGGNIQGAAVEWSIHELKAGEEKHLQVTAEASRLAERALLSVEAQGQPMSQAGNAVPRESVTQRAETAFAIIGAPALVLENSGALSPLEVGKRAIITVRVKNRGTLSARGVQLTLFLPAELRGIRGSGPVEGRLETQQVVFPALEEVSPGATATYQIEVEGVSSGSARVRAEVRALHLPQPLKEEQALSVIGTR